MAWKAISCAGAREALPSELGTRTPAGGRRSGAEDPTHISIDGVLVGLHARYAVSACWGAPRPMERVAPSRGTEPVVAAHIHGASGGRVYIADQRARAAHDGLEHV